MVEKKRILWIGDGGCPSGFARATHAICDVLVQSHDVAVLAINYQGDPHSYPYPLYTCWPGGDVFGVGRLIWMCDVVKPDVIVIQQDPWNFHHYFDQLKKIPEYDNVPVVGYVAVDGLNCKGKELNKLALAIFWTKFGQEQARLGGFTGKSVVIPLGVDTTLYTPGDRTQARQKTVFGKFIPHDVFIVGNVNRNQHRKRLDLTIQYFADWVKSYKINDAYLYLHIAPTGDKNGYDCVQLAEYYGIKDRLIMYEPAVFYGLPEEAMVNTYRCFNVQINTGQGEGFGLTTFEGMACGIPQIVGRWSALEELTKNVALQIPCTTTAATIGGMTGYVNVIGGIPDRQQFVAALQKVYKNPVNLQEKMRDAGLALVGQDQFRWENVGKAFQHALESTVFSEAMKVA